MYYLIYPGDTSKDLGIEVFASKEDAFKRASKIIQERGVLCIIIKGEEIPY